MSSRCKYYRAGDDHSDRCCEISEVVKQGSSDVQVPTLAAHAQCRVDVYGNPGQRGHDHDRALRLVQDALGAVPLYTRSRKQARPALRRWPWPLGCRPGGCQSCACRRQAALSARPQTTPGDPCRRMTYWLLACLILTNPPVSANG